MAGTLRMPASPSDRWKRSAASPVAQTPEVDDATLVAAAQTDPRAFAPLYRRYVDPVYRYCYRRLGNQHAAEDATGLIFTQALAALPRCRPASFRAWLFTIAHHTIFNDWRSHRNDQPLSPDDLTPDPAPNPEEVLLATETRETVYWLLAQLPIEQRRVLELRLAGLKGREIAGALGRSHGSVRIAQHRAMTRLREMMASRAMERPYDDTN